MSKHNHNEAFCLMKYRSDDGSEEEIIWNSRDGVTPFVITLESGKRAQHVDWAKDVYAPSHQPKSGNRIFIDMTKERALEIAQRNISQWSVDGTFDKYGKPDNLLEDLVESYSRPGAPDIKVVE